MLVPASVGQQRHTGVDEAGAEAVDQDALGREVDRERPCHVDEAALGGRVGDAVGGAAHAEDRGNVDDPRA